LYFAFIYFFKDFLSFSEFVVFFLITLLTGRVHLLGIGVHLHRPLLELRQLQLTVLFILFHQVRVGLDGGLAIGHVLIDDVVHLAVHQVGLFANMVLNTLV
jgi:hypothetical protein